MSEPEQLEELGVVDGVQTNPFASNRRHDRNSAEGVQVFRLSSSTFNCIDPD